MSARESLGAPISVGAPINFMGAPTDMGVRVKRMTQIRSWARGVMPTDACRVLRLVVGTRPAVRAVTPNQRGLNRVELTGYHTSIRTDHRNGT